MNIRDLFFESAQRLDGINSMADCQNWFDNRKEYYHFKIDEIPFSQLINWDMIQSDETPLTLAHSSGHFFQIAGIHVDYEYKDRTAEWTQPIIIQAEIGILGFITKKIDGVLHFLCQAKMEPGNIDYIQLSPTVQATRSNFRQVHRGRRPRYVEYFLDAAPDQMIVDSLQSEQGSRFLQKRNRNIVIYTEKDVPENDDYLWLTLGQIHSLLKRNNVINMDSRTVLASIPYDGAEQIDPRRVQDGLPRQILQTLTKPVDSVRYAEELRWLTYHKFQTEVSIQRIPLNQMKDWEFTDRNIFHRDHKYFSVLAASIEAASREVSGWTQPLMKSEHIGLMAAPIRIADNGDVEVLVQAKFEPGVADMLEIGPAIQCFPEDYMEEPLPFLAREILENQIGTVILDTMQSEEGGRFFREQNRNLFVLVQKGEITDLPEKYRWISLNHLKLMMNHTRLLNIELRCLLVSLMSLITEAL